jgi:hypothetical protein
MEPEIAQHRARTLPTLPGIVQDDLLQPDATSLASVWQSKTDLITKAILAAGTARPKMNPGS